jgi:methyl-accepting chemotaxis protein
MNEKRTLQSPPTIGQTLGRDSREGNMSQEAAEALTSKRLQEQRQRARMMAKQQQLSERLATTSQELSAGVEESQSAILQLKQSLEQLAAGAEQASAASEESSQSITRITENIKQISDNVALFMDTSLNVQQMMTASSTDISRLIEGVAAVAAKSSDSARQISDLEHQAKEIDEIILTVVNLADQTNLLALNAAIEAARAGDHGSGFAVVADEVRMLAETSEKSARDIKDVVEKFNQEIKAIVLAIATAEQASLQEIEKGRRIAETLRSIGAKVGVFVQSAKELAGSMLVFTSGVNEFENGARTIAQAAEEQAVNSGQALKAIEEQARALDDINHSAFELAELTEELTTSKNLGKSAEILSSAAEELSSSITEATHSSQQIMEAINNIDRSAELQSAATEQSAAAIVQISAAAGRVSTNAAQLEKNFREVSGLYEEGKQHTATMIDSITDALSSLDGNLKNLMLLEQQIRKVEKIVNIIDRVGIQTNLLAVNGAIEAAGAGKFGGGFALVAVDIRNLAQETAGNAEGIKDVIYMIRHQVSNVIRDLQTAKETARFEVEKSRRIVTESGRIEEELRRMIHNVGEIIRSLQEAESAVAESKIVVEQVASSAAEAAASCRQASHAGQEQNVGINELSRAIEEIANMADNFYA